MRTLNGDTDAWARLVSEADDRSISRPDGLACDLPARRVKRGVVGAPGGIERGYAPAVLLPQVIAQAARARYGTGRRRIHCLGLRIVQRRRVDERFLSKRRGLNIGLHRRCNQRHPSDVGIRVPCNKVRPGR